LEAELQVELEAELQAFIHLFQDIMWKMILRPVFRIYQPSEVEVEDGVTA